MRGELYWFNEWSLGLYDCEAFRAHSSELYLSDYAVLDAEKINEAGQEILNDKSRLDELIPVEYAVRTFGTIERETFTPIEQLNNMYFIDEILKAFTLVVKPVDSSNGDGIVVTDFDWTPEKLYSKLDPTKKYVVTELAVQAGYAEAIWPESANSLRFLAYCDPEPEIVACVHKWGLPGSGITDNWSRGGCTTAVENGYLTLTLEDFTQPLWRDGHYAGRDRYITEYCPSLTHFESGMLIQGKKLPFWQETVDMVKDCSDRVKSTLPYVGWDVIITDNGPKVIEGNPWPGVQLIQVHRSLPLLQHEGFKDFLLKNEVDGIRKA